VFTQTQGFTLGYYRAALSGLRNTRSKALLLNRAGFQQTVSSRDLLSCATQSWSAIVGCR